MTLTELLESVRRVEVRTNRLVNAARNSNPIEFDGFGNYGEFATIKSSMSSLSLFLIPSNSTGLEMTPCVVSRN